MNTRGSRETARVLNWAAGRLDSKYQVQPELGKEEAGVGSHQEGVGEGSAGNKCSVRVWKLPRPRAQERRIQRQLLLLSHQDKYLLSASETARSGSGQGPGFGLPDRLSR